MFRALLLLIVLSTGAATGLGPLENALVYPFDAARVAPKSAGAANMREVTRQINGETLILWVAQPAPSQPTILYFHGNAGSLATRAGRFNRFTARGYGVIAPAYRGSSGSTGSPSEQAITADTAHLYANLDAILPGLTPDQVIIYGESLGTGVALKLLAGDPDIAQPRGVVLEAPYTSIPDVAARAYPQIAPLVDRMINIWDSKTHAKSLRAPLLVIHGNRDRLIPIRQGRVIYATARSRNKRFLRVRGAGHADLWRSDTLPRLWRFIDVQSLSIR